MNIETLLSPTEVARAMHSSLADLRRWRAEGRGPRATRVGARVMYRKADVDAYLVSVVRESTELHNS
jgi:hypothetical protein